MKLDEARVMKTQIEINIESMLKEFTKETGLVVYISSEYSKIPTHSSPHFEDHVYYVKAEVKLK